MSNFELDNDEKLAEKAKEFIRMILTSNDERLDETAWITTSSDDKSMFPDMPFVDMPISVREAMITRLFNKPFLKFDCRGTDRCHYENTITLNPTLDEEQTISAEKDQNSRKAMSEMAKTSDDSSLDEPGFISGEYVPFREDFSIENFDFWSRTYKNGDNIPRIDEVTVPVTQRELLLVGLDPQIIGWEPLEHKKTQENLKEEESKETKEVDESKNGLLKRIKMLINRDKTHRE